MTALFNFVALCLASIGPGKSQTCSHDEPQQQDQTILLQSPLAYQRVPIEVATQTKNSERKSIDSQSSPNVTLSALAPAEISKDGMTMERKTHYRNGTWNYLKRDFVGASPVVNQTPCTEDAYTPSLLEQQWAQHVDAWTADHCKHLNEPIAKAWIKGNIDGQFDPNIFSKICRKGKVPQFIEPLAGILRDPRFLCHNDFGPMSVDWLVFPSSQILTAGAKARFYDAGGSHFNDAMRFFLQTYLDHGIIFDEVYAWEIEKQGTEAYWSGVANETRAFWEPRLTFYDGIGVTAASGSEHNPVSRIFKSCAPDDFCAMKLDIDTPSVELALVQQLLNSSDLTKAKVDAFFFEHHVHGVMEEYGWGGKAAGTFADSYKIFGDLRKLGVRAHSWV